MADDSASTSLGAVMDVLGPRVAVATAKEAKVTSPLELDDVSRLAATPDHIARTNSSLNGMFSTAARNEGSMMSSTEICTSGNSPMQYSRIKGMSFGASFPLSLPFLDFGECALSLPLSVRNRRALGAFRRMPHESRLRLCPCMVVCSLR